jgi:hypothetical protein
MSNYTKLTAYDTKDSLTTGDPLKRVKGTELDDEFDAISVAIATKANSASPEFTGTPTVPTAAAGTNTTQAASTAFIQAAISALYPVGSIYTNASNSTNPATLLGFGTWSAFAAGRVLIGLDATNALFDTAEETGGSANAINVSHNHTATSTVNDNGHRHQTGARDSTADFGGNNTTEFVASYPSSNQPYTSTVTTGITVSTSVSTVGSSGTNANYQPYITVYMWKRTA